MARIRKLEINNFRGIKELVWFPAPGINCLIGPGDSGKSTILDAIDLTLGARRSIQFTDAEFFGMEVDEPITIAVTLGELDDKLKNLDSYGLYVGSFDPETREIEDEPKAGTETVITIRLRVAGDLEPEWTLVSARAEAQGQSRSLGWADRERTAAARIGVMGSFHLGWRKGSVLNRISDARADAAGALAKAAREARTAFGDAAKDQLAQTLDIVVETAADLGVPIGDGLRAMLDTQSVSFSGGTISLHDEAGVPLGGLGVGSTRLLVAGLQRRAAAHSTVVLVDEVEHGLEPHRIIRFLGSLGAKEAQAPLQVFATTHSPVTLRELSGDQLFIVRSLGEKHVVRAVGTENEFQGTIRTYPEAFLAKSVIVCEGASEVGFVRGIDQYRVAKETVAIGAHGVALIDGKGSSPDVLVARAMAFRTLGYRVAVLRDSDVPASAAADAAFLDAGGAIVSWSHGRALEDELFLGLTESAVHALLNRAIELHGRDLIDEHIKSVSQNATDLSAVRVEGVTNGFSAETRQILGAAARKRKVGWFKSVTRMEDAARDIVGPDLENADPVLRRLVDEVFAWAGNARS